LILFQNYLVLCDLDAKLNGGARRLFRENTDDKLAVSATVGFVNVLLGDLDGGVYVVVAVF
jgi:hypothetical protein